MRPITFPRLLAAAALAGAALPAACVRDTVPTGVPAADAPVLALRCVAEVHTATLTCAEAVPLVPEGRRAMILGNQNGYLRLWSSGASYSPETARFRADVVLRNLLLQAMGTADGTTPDPAGIRVFFHEGPMLTGGYGLVRVANADGTGTFTGAQQPYFRYPGLLRPFETSAPRTWEFEVPPSVMTFAFAVYVSASLAPSSLVLNEIMADPEGVPDSVGEWIELVNPGIDTLDLTGWTLASGSDPGAALPPVRVARYAHVVLARNGDPALNGGVAAQGVYRGVTLGNDDGDWLALRDPAGRTVDSVSWGAADGPSSAPPAGASRALQGHLLDNTHLSGSGSAWSTSTHAYGPGGRGTPGTRNHDVAVRAPTALVAVTPTLVAGAPFTVLSDTPRVRLTDPENQGLGGIPVTWTLADSSGVVTPYGAVTDVAGGARATWTLGGRVTGQTLTVRAAGLPPVVFTSWLPPLLEVRRPAADTVVRDTLRVEVAVRRAAPVMSATATVGTATVRLDGSAAPLFRGSLGPATLVPGPNTLVVRVVDAGGGDTTLHVPFRYDREPELSIDRPFEGQVARPKLRVRASCTDAGPGGCVVLLVETPAGTVGAGATPGEIDQEIDLSRSEGRQVTLRFRARDAEGWRPDVVRRVFVESSPALVPVDSAGFAILDADADRVLYLDSVGADLALKVRALGGGPATTLFTTQTLSVPEAWLTPRGALLRARSPSTGDDRLIDATPAAATEVGRVPRWGSYVSVRTPWAAWASGRAYLLDLATGTKVSLPFEVRDSAVDVTPDGAVVYPRFVNSDLRRLYRYAQGTVVQLTGISNAMDTRPKTDGSLVVFRRDSLPTGWRRLLLRQPGGEVEVLSASRWSGLAGDPASTHQVANGWVAYLRVEAGGTERAWLRTPLGQHVQLTEGTGSIVRLAPDGRLLVATSRPSRVWLARLDSDPRLVAVSNDWRAAAPRPTWRDGYFYITIGRSLFRLEP